MDTLIIPDTTTDTETSTDLEDMYVVIVHNDPINLMHDVKNLFMLILEVDDVKASQLMLEIHSNGRTAVFTGSYDECNEKAVRLQKATLTVTVEEA